MIKTIIRNRLFFWFGGDQSAQTLHNVTDDIVGFIRPHIHIGWALMFSAGWAAGAISTITFVYFAVVG